MQQAEGGLSGFASRLGGRMQAVGRQMTMALSLPLIGIGTAAATLATGWESAFAGVIKTVEGTPEQLAAVETQLRTMATAPDSLVSGLANAHTELARIAELGGQLGVPLEQLAGFTEVVAQLTMSTDLTAESAAMMAAQFANITGMEFGNMTAFGSTIVALGNNMATTESTVLEFAQRLSGAGVQAGMSEPDILALGATMASLGLNAEAGASAMTQVINAFMQASAEAATGGDMIDGFTEIMGVSAAEFATLWSTDPVAAIDLFTGKLAEMDPAAQIAALDAFGLSGLRTTDTVRRLGSSQGLLTEATTLANEAWTEANALQTEAATRAGTSESQFNTLRNRLNDAGITIGNALLPGLVDLAEELGNVAMQISQADPEVLGLVVRLGLLAVAAGPVVSAIGTVVSIVGAIGAPVLMAAGGIALLVAASGQAGPALELAGQAVGQFANALVAFASGDGAAALESLRGGVASVVEALGRVAGGLADNLISAIEDLTGLDLPSAGEALTIGGGIVESAFRAVELIFQNGGFLIEQSVTAVRLKILQALADLRADVLAASGVLQIDIAPNVNAALAQTQVQAAGYAMGSRVMEQLRAALAAGDFTEPITIPNVEVAVDLADGSSVKFTGEPTIAPSDLETVIAAVQLALSTGDEEGMGFLLNLAPELGVDVNTVAAQMYAHLLTSGAMVEAMEFRERWDPVLDVDLLSIGNQMATGIRTAAAATTPTATVRTTIIVDPVVDASRVGPAVASVAGFGTGSGIIQGNAGGAPRFAGGGMMGEDGIAWLRRDEMVLTPDQQRALAGAGRGINVNLTAYGQSPHELLDLVRRAAAEAG